jgi:hypothetical protein
VDRRLLSDRGNGRGADLWPARRQLWPPQGDVLCARRVHGGFGAVRNGADHRIAGAGAYPARAGRRRTDDVVAGACRRDDSAARACALPRLSRRGGGLRQYVRPGGRRLSHRAFRLAVDLSGQHPDRHWRDVFDDAAAQSGDRAIAVARRSGRIVLFHAVRRHHLAGARTGTACRIIESAAWRRSAGNRIDRAGAAGAPGEPRGIAADPALAFASAGDLAQRRAGRLPRLWYR